jgi:hypothetical protein
MKNVFWDIKTQSVPHRRHITSPLQSRVSSCYVRFEVFTAVTTKNAVFWDITPSDILRNDVLEEPSASIIRVKESVNYERWA